MALMVPQSGKQQCCGCEHRRTARRRVEPNSTLNRLSSNRNVVTGTRIEAQWPTLSGFLAILSWTALVPYMFAILLLLRDLALGGYMCVKQRESRKKFRTLQRDRNKISTRRTQSVPDHNDGLVYV
jgi:hypothetical protein